MKPEAEAPRKLGIPCLSAQDMVQEISARLRLARLWCQRHWKVLRDPCLPSSAKFGLYTLCVRPILTYGCEVWTLDDRSTKRLLSFERSILTEIYKSKYSNKNPKRLRPTIHAVYHRYKDVNVICHVEGTRLHWDMLLQAEETALKGRNKNKKYVKWWDHPKPTASKNTKGHDHGVRILTPRDSAENLRHVSKRPESCSRRTRLKDDSLG